MIEAIKKENLSNIVNNKKELEREELHRAIWAIADELRGAGIPAH